MPPKHLVSETHCVASQTLGLMWKDTYKKQVFLVINCHLLRLCACAYACVLTVNCSGRMSHNVHIARSQYARSAFPLAPHALVFVAKLSH